MKNEFFKILIFTVAGLFISMGAFAQGKVIEGNVTDEDGQPLPGVSIVVKGTSQGTITNADGIYRIEVDESANVLVFSFIGMKSQEKVIGDSSSIDVVMSPEVTGLEEVIVIGYGTQKKRNLTGAVSAIDNEKLEDRPIVNVGQGLQGVIPNLNISFSDGSAGAGADFNIRGFTSTNGGGPLILVDGVEMDPNLVNPSDIEQISVLKDASAAAVYGSRAAFGVVLITTKSGTKDAKPIIELSTNYSMNRPTETPDLVNSLGLVEFRQEKAENLNTGDPFSEERIAELRAHLEDPVNNPAAYINPEDETKYIYVGSTDWFEEVFEKYSPTLQTTLSVRGGGEKLSYFVTGGALNQDGILKYGNDYYDRYNVRTKLGYQITNWLYLDFNNVYTRTEQDKVFNYPGVGNIWHDMTRKNIFLPVCNPDGTFTENPIALLDKGGRDKTLTSDMRSTLGGEIRPIEGLLINGSYTYNAFHQRRKQHKKEVERYDGPADQVEGESIHTTPTELRLDYRENIYEAINIYAEYENTFNDIHYFKSTLGYNKEGKNFSYSNSTNLHLVTDQLPSMNLTTGTPSVTENMTSWALEGYFYRLNYIFRDKYLVTLNGRYDATSRFPEKDRWGFFPSFSLGWRITEEPFFAQIKNVMNDFKIRGSYGELGNQSLRSNFPYLPTLNPYRPTVILAGDRPLSVAQPLLVSSSLTWETAISRNIGFDAAMFDSRMQYSFDYFEREVVDQLAPGKAVPATLGAPAPQANAVESITRGWELEWSWRDRIGGFSYNFGFNIADSQAEITKYDNPTKSLSVPFYEGQKIGEIWGLEANGLFESAEEYQATGLDYSNLTSIPIEGGDVYYVDQNDDDKIDYGINTVDNPGDRKIIGNSTPRYTYGITLGGSWKGISLDIFMQGVAKRDLALGSGLFWPDESSTPSIHHLNYWTEDNKDAYWPRVLGREGDFNYLTSDRYLQDFSYLRMKQLSVSYRLPQAWLKPVNMKSARIYFTGQNLFEFDNIIKGFDPEISERGQGGWGSGKSYPFGRSLSMGVNVSF